MPGCSSAWRQPALLQQATRCARRHPAWGSGTTRRSPLRRLFRTASLSQQAELLQQEPQASASTRRIDAAPPSAAADPGAAPGTSGDAAAPKPADNGLVVTTFKWPAALGGHSVSVCGSFSGWEPLELHQSQPGGDFVRSLALPPGPIYFKYLVDGSEWICSPCEPVVKNGVGYNNHRLIQATAIFTWRSSELGGHDVLLTGSFNSWAELLPLAPNPATGLHTLRCCLPQGHYQFQFFVDGQWLLCPTQPSSLTEQGRLVNCIDVQAPPAFHIHYATGWKSAMLHYRWAAAPGEPAQPWQVVATHSTASRARPLGGSWLTATIPAQPLPHAPKLKTPAPALVTANGAAASIVNGIGYSASPPNGSAHINGNSNGNGGTYASEVAGVLMWDGTGMQGGSASDTGGHGYRALEFFLSSSDGSKEDRPVGGGAYRCAHPGGYKLLRGQLRPFPKATQPPMMLVSDLDGTMVGDGEEADAATRDFAAYWEDNAALAGGVLVYNTGRSLGQFQGLLEWKAGALPVPDVLITAVGTKIWRLDTQGGTRGTATGQSWQEDQQWARTLDEGWNLDKIRTCIQSVLDRFRDAASWLDNGSEHPHRVCISARADVTPAVTAAVRERVAEAGLQVKVIVSGTGDWRYVDVTSARAGKLAALEYVRQLYGVHRERCVAAGDSGNDTLMLGGRNLAIVVGNAQPELVGWVLEQAQEDRLVVTDAPMARGILEGLARHGLY